MPDIPIVVYTDQANLPRDAFDEIRPIQNPRHSFIDKIAPLSDPPFERTLFLDTDTYLCAPVGDLFEILDRVDLALAHAPYRHDRPFVTPNCFPELNTGVVVYRHSAASNELFADWLRLYEEEVQETGRMDSDQPAFRAALYRSKLSFSVLPPEYNLRTVMPAAVGRCSVRIIHGRGPKMEELARWVNASRAIRLFLPGVLQLQSRHFGILSGPGRVVGAMVQAGILPFVLAEQGLRFFKRRVLGSGGK
jgi:hypothetical protein